MSALNPTSVMFKPSYLRQFSKLANFLVAIVKVGFYSTRNDNKISFLNFIKKPNFLSNLVTFYSDKYLELLIFLLGF